MPVNAWARGAQVRIVGQIHGQMTVNVLHMSTDLVANDQGEIDAILLALAEALRDCVVQFLLPAVSSDWRFVQTDAKMIFPLPSDPIIVTGVPENVGELSPASHSFAASLVNVRTGIGGRRGRGKIFLPPPGESEVAQSLIDGPTLVLIAAFLSCVATKFMGATPESEWHYGILSQKDMAGSPGNFNSAFRLAASLNPSSDCAVMTSRRRGRGV